MSTILTLVPDLMFGTRIQDVATHMGYKTVELTAGEDWAAVMEREKPPLVLVALDAADWAKAVKAAKQSGARVLAFGSHKNLELMQAARQAGCDQVVARSRIASDLPGLLKRFVDE